MKTHKKRNGTRPASNEPRTVLLITRVSTHLQAENDEGSLKNQLQRLRAYMEYKRTSGEDWREVAVIELRAISGKDAVRSPEFQPVFEQIGERRANTVLCPALDRVCGSVSDLLALFEFLSDHGVEFVSLREQFDTTIPQGRFVATILMALAQMEREITSQRTAEAMYDRAQRGLWNGGQVLGYDLNPERPGCLIPNPVEALLVNLAFDTYLELGSIKETAEALNRRGCQTKSFESRRGKHHPGTKFSISSMQYLLKNVAYKGMKEINKRGLKGQEYRLVDAVWPGIVEEEKYDKTQRLMAANGRTNHNGSRPVRHTYALGKLLRCGRCQGPMEGRSGTGKLKVVYYYYMCKDKSCGIRVAAEEVEGAVLHRLGELAREESLLGRLVGETNARLQRQTPGLLKQRQGLQRDLDEVNRTADRLLTGWASLEDDSISNAFISDKLNQLTRQRSDLESGLAEVDGALEAAKQQGVDVVVVRRAMANISGVYACSSPTNSGS